jgi:hypothetical protein
MRELGGPQLCCEPAVALGILEVLAGWKSRERWGLGAFATPYSDLIALSP